MNPVQSLFFVLPLVLFVSVQCKKMCILNDYVCMTRGAQKLFKSLTNIDSLHLDEIKGTTGNIKFKVTNLTLSGLQNCDMTFATANRIELTYETHLTCPKFIITYFYEVNGKVHDFEVEGKSNGMLTSTNYVIIIYGKYGMNISETDKRPHFYTKSFYLDTHPGSLKFESEKLLNTKGVDIAPQLTILLNSNWRAYERHLRDLVMTSFMRTVLSALDKKLSTLSLSESFPDDS